MCLAVLILEIMHKTYSNCTVASSGSLRKHVKHLVKKHLNEHIIYSNILLLTEKRFWNLSSLLHNLTYLSLLNSFLLLPKKPQQLFFQVTCLRLTSYQIFSLNNLYFPAVSHTFLGPVFCGSRFFRDQVFLGPGFSMSRFFWVWV